MPAQLASPVRTPATFLHDLVAAARAAGLTADRQRIADGVAPFADRFCTQPVELRTTSVALDRREVSFRFVDETARGELWTQARSWFELGGLNVQFMNAVHVAFDVRAEGIDADVRTGFRKAWVFLTAGHALARFARLDAAPPALLRAATVLERYRLARMSIVGTDHFNGTCNLYPMLAPGWAKPEVVRDLARDLGFAPLESTWLEHMERTVAANFTFSWSSEHVERLSFYRPATSVAELPDDVMLRRFATECPCIAPQRAFIPSVAYARNGHYRKLEVDYDGNMMGVLVRCAQVPAAS